MHTLIVAPDQPAHFPLHVYVKIQTINNANLYAQLCNPLHA